MDQPSPPRRSPWRFSLRELLLLTLAIAAFLGWGRAVYQRYIPFVPTPFLSGLDVSRDVFLVRQQIGEQPETWSSRGAGGSTSPQRKALDYRFQFPLETGKGQLFMEKLRQRLLDQLVANDCRIGGSGRGSASGLADFDVRYVRGAVEGSIRVILVPSGDEARLLVFVEERRASP